VPRHWRHWHVGTEAVGLAGAFLAGSELELYGEALAMRCYPVLQSACFRCHSQIVGFLTRSTR